MLKMIFVKNEFLCNMHKEIDFVKRMYDNVKGNEYSKRVKEQNI